MNLSSRRLRPTPDIEAEELLTPAEVARLFRVSPSTVTRWAKTGRLATVRTLGGHHRFRAAEVYALLKGDATDPAAPAENFQPRQTSAATKAK